MNNIETKYLDDIDNANEAFIDAYYESMGDIHYAYSVRNEAERKAERDYQQALAELSEEGDVMTNKIIYEVFPSLLRALEDVLEKEGDFAFLSDSEYRKLNADYHYYEGIFLRLKLKYNRKSITKQELAPLPTYIDSDEGADICMKQKRSKDIDMIL